ncbi:MAG: carboxypeptidase-like regulatory domain-containing protein [Planctomycetaceae bacterium]|nr:carboxypeptidase-like regulatory domain-containing protein [Planctomycetaceae bacterium]
MRILFFTLILSAVLFIGCTNSSEPSDLPKLYNCVITITQEGKPVSGAIIELIAQDTNNTKYVPLQYTNVHGTAVMTTYGFTGVPAGKYKIVVSKNIEAETTVKDQDTGENIIVGGIKYQMIEPVYSNPEITPLEIEITGKEKKTEQTFDVGKEIKEMINVAK